MRLYGIGRVLIVFNNASLASHPVHGHSHLIFRLCNQNHKKYWLEGMNATILLVSMWHTHWPSVIVQIMLKGRMFWSYQKWDTPLYMLYCSDLETSVFIFFLETSRVLVARENIELGKRICGCKTPKKFSVPVWTDLPLSKLEHPPNHPPMSTRINVYMIFWTTGNK